MDSKRHFNTEIPYGLLELRRLIKTEKIVTFLLKFAPDFPRNIFP
jgi:hypothetical protein